MSLFLMDVDFSCDGILIQIFYAHRFVGKDVGACNQHSWHHISHIQICKQLIVRWSTRACFFYVWDFLQLSERWRLGVSRCLTAYQDPSTVCAQSQLIFVPWMVEQFVLIRTYPLGTWTWTWTLIFLLSVEYYILTWWWCHEDTETL